MPRLSHAHKEGTSTHYKVHWSPRLLIWTCLLLVLATRVLFWPQGYWEWDEVLFDEGLQHFNIEAHAPHPPGFPLFIFFGKLLHGLGLARIDAMVSLSVLGSALGFLGVYAIASELFRREDMGLAAACLTSFYPAQVFFGTVPMSDALGNGLALFSLGLALQGLILSGRAQREGRLFFAALFTGIALGVRPPLILFLVLPWAMILGSLLLRARFRKLTLTLLILAGSCLPWAIAIVISMGGLTRTIEIFGQYNALTASADQIAHSLRDFGLSGVLKRWFIWPLGWVWPATALLATSAVGWLVLVARSETRRLCIFSTVAVLPYIAYVFTRHSSQYGPRYGLLALPFLILFAPVALDFVALRLIAAVHVPDGTKQRYAARVQGLFCLLTVLVPATWLRRVYRNVEKTPPAHAAMNYVLAQAKLGPVTLTATPGFAAHARFLLPGIPSFSASYQRFPIIAEEFLHHREKLLEPGRRWLRLQEFPLPGSVPLFSLSLRSKAYKQLGRPRLQSAFVFEDHSRYLPLTGFGDSYETDGFYMHELRADAAIGTVNDAAGVLHFEYSARTHWPLRRPLRLSWYACKDWRHQRIDPSDRVLFEQTLVPKKWGKASFVIGPCKLRTIQALRLAVRNLDGSTPKEGTALLLHSIRFYRTDS